MPPTNLWRHTAVVTTHGTCVSVPSTFSTYLRIFKPHSKDIPLVVPVQRDLVGLHAPTAQTAFHVSRHQAITSCLQATHRPHDIALAAQKISQVSLPNKNPEEPPSWKGASIPSPPKKVTVMAYIPPCETRVTPWRCVLLLWKWSTTLSDKERLPHR
jgi:hypothetical protein